MAVQLHRKLGLASLLLLTAHVVLLVADAVMQGASPAGVLVPFGDERSMDIVAFYVLIGLGLLAYDRRLRHERWLAIHRMIGMLFLLGTLHAAMQPGTAGSQVPIFGRWIALQAPGGRSATNGSTRVQLT